MNKIGYLFIDYFRSHFSSNKSISKMYCGTFEGIMKIN